MECIFALILAMLSRLDLIAVCLSLFFGCGRQVDGATAAATESGNVSLTLIAESDQGGFLSINAITLATNDMRKSCEFYTALGMRQTYPAPAVSIARRSELS